MGQLLRAAANQAVLCFCSQYYEMSYGLNIEMHKQVSRGGGGGRSKLSAGDGEEEAEVGVSVRQ